MTTNDKHSDWPKCRHRSHVGISTYLKDTEESHRGRYPQQGNQAEFLDLGASQGSRYIVADYDIWKSSLFSSALEGAILNVG